MAGPLTIVVRARDSAHQQGESLAASSPPGPTPYEGCFYHPDDGHLADGLDGAGAGRCLSNAPGSPRTLANGIIRLEQPLAANRHGMTLHAALSDAAGVVTEASCAAHLDLAPRLDLVIPDERRRLWSCADPHLYDIEIVLRDGAGEIIDRATTYAGLRSISLDGVQFKINGDVLFQRLVLDQGYYPDGVMTAPTDDALRNDILLSQAAGFNGARLHQKVFEERFLYHADKLGYLVWGEFADWGAGDQGPQIDHQRPGVTYVAQWLEALERDYSHPSIIGWCGLNETWASAAPTASTRAGRRLAGRCSCAAKAMDTSRPVLETLPGTRTASRESDIYDSHDYEQNPVKFARHHTGLRHGRPYLNKGGENQPGDWSYPYAGQPFFLSEFGGIHWNPRAAPILNNGTHSGEEITKVSWGYGRTPQTLDEFYARFEGLCEVLLADPHMFGYCYTQLTDVYQEENGLLFFDRSEKFDHARLHAIQTRAAAIEKVGGAVAPEELPAAIPGPGRSPAASAAPGSMQSFASLTRKEVSANEGGTTSQPNP